MLVVAKHYNIIKFEFSKAEIDYFKYVCYFDEDEELALEMKMRRKSNQQIADSLGTSLSTANRTIKRMKKKIIRALK